MKKGIRQNREVVLGSTAQMLAVGWEDCRDGVCEEWVALLSVWYTDGYSWLQKRRCKSQLGPSGKLECLYEKAANACPSVWGMKKKSVRKDPERTKVRWSRWGRASDPGAGTHTAASEVLHVRPGGYFLRSVESTCWSREKYKKETSTERKCYKQATISISPCPACRREDGETGNEK